MLNKTGGRRDVMEAVTKYRIPFDPVPVAAIFLILVAKVGRRISAESVDQEGMRSKLKRPRSFSFPAEIKLLTRFLIRSI